MSESLEEKLSPGKGFAYSAVVGGLSQLIFPAYNLYSMIVNSVIYGALLPLVQKIFYRDVPLSKLYKNAPIEAAGLFAGQAAVGYLT